MKCTACAADSREGSRFCTQCGTALALSCGSCGAPLEPAARFCGGCGSPTGAEAPRSNDAPELPGAFGDGRYVVKSFLGEGGRKRVYLAHDTKLDRDVAFAVIKTEGLDAAGRSRVQREAQAMGRLGDHAHVVTVFDTGEDGGQPYIVSQYMAGGDLAEALRQRDDHRLPVEAALKVAEQVASGLEHAHRHGVIHRDLKPGNIWFDSPGVAKIGDFGLAVALDRSRLTMAGMMVGTASYMPPEQAMGGETSPASDLYSLGCVLYEMVTGRPPFVGDDTVAVISQHVNTPPVSPSWHNPGCPPDLEAVILRLLEKDPKERFARASDVLSALAAVSPLLQAGAEAEGARAKAPAADAANPIYRRTFVGREAELKQLESAFDAALSGQGALVMVVGEPGIGKTTLTEQLTTYVRMRGGEALTGHCYEEGSLSIPYLPFVEALRSFVSARDGEELSGLLGSGAGEVARIVSEVRDRVDVTPAPPSTPEEARFRLFQAVTAFLRNAAAVRALCLVLEDLHDADQGTMEMLVHLSRHLAGARLLLVGTYRDVEVDRSHPLSAALAELRRNDRFQRVPLRGLSPQEVQKMISHIAGQEIPYELGEAIYRQTEGNPLFVQELIRNAAEEGLIKREGGRWVATVDSLVNYIPEGLRDVIGRRLSRLGESCNRVLGVAAVIGRDFAVEVLGRVAGVSEEELLGALEEGARVSLIEEMRGRREARYRFTHAFFRQTLYEEMIAPRRLRMHNEIAKALEAHYAGREEEHAAELAEHFAHSSTEDDLRKAVHYGKLAAERAVSVHAYGEAVRHLHQALEVQEVLDPKDGAGCLAILVQLANSLLPAGEAGRLLDEVGPRAFDLAESLGESTTAARIAETMTFGLVYKHGMVFATPEYRLWTSRVDKHAAPGSRERVMADGMKSWTHWVSGELAECWRLRWQALDLARRIGDRDALAYAGFAFIVTGVPMKWDSERERVARELSDVRLTGAPPLIVSQFLFSLGAALASAGDREAAERCWNELDTYAERVRDAYAESWAMNAYAGRLRFSGAFDRAVETCEAFIARTAGTGIEAWGRLMGTWAMTLSLLELGRSEELVEAVSAWRTLPYGRATIALMLARAGRMEEARKEMWTYVEECGLGKPDDWIEDVSLAYLLETAVLTGDTRAVETLYRRGLSAEDRYGFGFGTIARALARAAHFLGDSAAARRHTEAAQRLAEQIGDRAERALVAVTLAEILLDGFPGERALAAELLANATPELQAMKLQPALERALRARLRLQGLAGTDVQTSIDAVVSAVGDEKPDLQPHAAPDGTVTIMFSDIEGSTEMTDRLGDARWMEVLREHNAIIRAAIRAHRGFEVKSEGDGFMVAFGSAASALECAVAVQRALAERNRTAEEPVMVRMGLHSGEVIREGEDFFGRNVILAARVASQARGGEVLVSAVLKALVAGADFNWGEPRVVELKGLAGQHELWPVAWPVP